MDEQMAIQGKESVVTKAKGHRIKEFLKKPFVKEITLSALPGLYCYIVIFILGEILISGGKSDRNIYTVIALIVFLIAAQVVLIKKGAYSDLRKTITSSITITLVFAIADYLVINLFLMKNNYEIYKFWPNYLVYLTTLTLPFIRSNTEKINAGKVKTLLTKLERTL